MSFVASIVGDSNEIRAKVTKYGQLVTAPIKYSTPVAKPLLNPDEAVNFIEPKAGSSIIITDIIVSAGKNVSNTTPADIQIYEALQDDTLDQVALIVRPQLVGSANEAYIGLNLIVPEGLYVNATTDDAEVLVTIMFYRVPVDSV